VVPDVALVALITTYEQHTGLGHLPADRPTDRHTIVGTRNMKDESKIIIIDKARMQAISSVPLFSLNTSCRTQALAREREERMHVEGTS
jgi:hypothetical protein